MHERIKSQMLKPVACKISDELSDRRARTKESVAAATGYANRSARLPTSTWDQCVLTGSLRTWRTRPTPGTSCSSSPASRFHSDADKKRL
jgi:hypothetical protein